MNFWQFKFKDELWENFQQLEVGDTFTTTITRNEKNKLNNKIGDIVFWYRTGTKKDIINGIYFVTEFISNVREDEEYTNNYSVEMRIVESHKDNPFIIQDNGFEHIILETKKGNYIQYIRYLFKDNDKGAELYSLLNKNNQKLEKLETLESDSCNEIERIKDDNINSGKMFNPFLDMNLIKLEVKHLSFITNLLNPRGTHLHGDKFLKNFLKSLSEYEDQESNKYLLEMLSTNNNIRVEAEKVLDNGRIDIYIESDEYIIAIEGKIESKDHANQLLKYDNFLQKQNKPYLLVYLTKEGEEPTKEAPNKLQLMSFKEGIKDFIDYSLEENIPDKIKTTLDEYQKSLTTYLNNLEPSWTYTLDILDEITSSKNNFKKYQNMRDIYYRDPKKYKYTAIEDVAINFEKSKAYIEILFFKKLYEKILKKIDKENMEYELEESTLLMDMDSNISIMKNINDVYQKRKTRLSPIRDEDFVLGLVGFNIKIKDDISENNICIMNTVLGLIITTGEAKMYATLLPIDFIPVLNMEKILEPNLFYSNRINKFLDASFLDTHVKKVIDLISV